MNDLISNFPVRTWKKKLEVARDFFLGKKTKISPLCKYNRKSISYLFGKFLVNKKKNILLLEEVNPPL